jgi:hypothetical protein
MSLDDRRLQLHPILAAAFATILLDITPIKLLHPPPWGGATLSVPRRRDPVKHSPFSYPFVNFVGTTR